MISDEDKAKIFNSVTRNWQGTHMVFPYRGYKNIIIKAESILKVIEDAVKEAETND